MVFAMKVRPSEGTAPAYGRQRAQELLLLPRAGVLRRTGSFLFRS
ncbi:hypothetical protein SANTM175S_04793 [Streptomyces antimycoticus]